MYYHTTYQLQNRLYSNAMISTIHHWPACAKIFFGDGNGCCDYDYDCDLDCGTVGPWDRGLYFPYAPWDWYIYPYMNWLEFMAYIM